MSYIRVLLKLVFLFIWTAIVMGSIFWATEAPGEINAKLTGFMRIAAYGTVGAVFIFSVYLGLYVMYSVADSVFNDFKRIQKERRFKRSSE